MVTVFGTEITGGYVNGEPIEEIYAYGVKVWPENSGTFYISWTPTSLTGSFRINGSTYNFEDYNGYFSGFGGVITSQAFISAGMSTVETNALEVRSYAFASCPSLRTVSMSCCDYLAPMAFNSCSRLRSVSLPVCTVLRAYAFAYCSSLSSIELPECRRISNNAFASCTSLTYVSLPKCEYLSTMTFFNCTNLRSIDLPACTDIEGGPFMCCTLDSVSLPVCSNANGVFYQCTIPTVDLPACTFVGNYTFVGVISSIYLRASSVCSIASGPVFADDISEYSVFVPASLVSDYKNDSGWSRYSSWIYPIE